MWTFNGPFRSRADIFLLHQRMTFDRKYLPELISIVKHTLKKMPWQSHTKEYKKLQLTHTESSS